MDDDKPTLNQLSFLAETLQRDEALNKHFDMSRAFDRVAEGVKTVKYKKYIHFLIMHGKRSKLNEVILKLGFPRKQYD